MGSPYRRRPGATPLRVRPRLEHEPMTTTAEERVPIARLRAGSPIEGVFACTRKDRMTARTGSAYLALELRDRSGAIPARVFRDAGYHAGRAERGGPAPRARAGRFGRGGLVSVTGRVERFRDDLSAELTAIVRVEPGEVDPAEFLPAA